MNSFKELVLSFFEASRERLKNPAVGTFVLAWIAINWRFVAILFFSNSSLEDRIDLIEECYLRIDLNIIYPILAMGIYMLILPNLMAVFDALSQKAIAYRKKVSYLNKLEDMRAKNKHTLEDVIAQQEIASEERQLEIIEDGQDIKKLKEQITKLENERNELQKRLTIQPSKPAPTSNYQTTNTTKTINPPKSTSSDKSSKKVSNVAEPVKPLPTSPDFPAMRDNVIRNVAKSEREWVLLYGFYASEFGTSEFNRKNIIDAYAESKRDTSQRLRNLTQSINTLVKQGSIRFLNDEDILLTDSGISLAKEILTR